MGNQFNILDYTDGPLLKTGQVVDQTPAGRTTKDDGGFQRGITGSKLDGQYIILVSNQYSGTTPVTVNSVVDNHTNECVFDKVTGLMWNREHTAPIYTGGNLLWDDTAGNNEDSFKYCDEANLSLLSGFSDWRIPNIVEINSIIELSGGNGRPNETAFPVFSVTLLQSSSSVANNTTNYISTSSGAGVGGSSPKTSFRSPTMLCRLGVES